MKIKKKNIFEKPENGDEQEVFEELVKSKDFLVERIYTTKAFKQPGKWYDQERDEWVLLLQGNALLEFEEEKIVRLDKGDYIFIPVHKKHRIRQSSEESNCIWLAIHGNFK